MEKASWYHVEDIGNQGKVTHESSDGMNVH
jgi:hypothetical protein